MLSFVYALALYSKYLSNIFFINALELFSIWLKLSISFVLPSSSLSESEIYSLMPLFSEFTSSSFSSCLLFRILSFFISESLWTSISCALVRTYVNSIRSFCSFCSRSLLCFCKFRMFSSLESIYCF